MIQLYTNMQGKYLASTYYRVEVPLLVSNRLRLDVAPFVSTPESLNDDVDISAFFNSDIASLRQTPSMWLTERIKILRGFRPRRGRNKEWRWPPSFVMDTDDDVFNCSPFNPAFRVLGWRVEGKEIPAGQGVEHSHASDGGNHALVWKDGLEGFDVARNKETCARMRENMESADAVTCTTEACADYVRRETGQRNIYVFPNSVLPESYPDYGAVSFVKDDPDEIRILWQGGDSHSEDLEPLSHAISHLSRKYPKVKWIFWGALFDWIVHDIPAGRYEFHRWVDAKAYFTKLGTIAHDINIAPLADQIFNKSKSAIKMYESACLKNPVMTVAQNFGPYAAEIIDGETGVLFNDPSQFIDKMSWMIEDAAERKRIAANAKDWTMENRSAYKTVPELFKFYERLREEKKIAMPPTPEDEMVTSEEGINQLQAAAEGADHAVPAQ